MTNAPAAKPRPAYPPCPGPGCGGNMFQFAEAGNPDSGLYRCQACGVVWNWLGWYGPTQEGMRWRRVGGPDGEESLAVLGGPAVEPQPPAAPTSARKIAAECDRVKEMLLAKNARYGDSALHPVRQFSKADAAEQIRVRIDDKLSRLARGSGPEDEDVVLDLIGYLILLRVAESKG